MTPERLQQIEDLFHAARERPPAERAALLDAADSEVRHEVEALLAQREDPILGRPVPGPAAMLADTATSTQLAGGSQLGPYTVETALGRGGMGEVYRARDTRLNRSVAIKVASHQFSDRFEREARAIAALNHPHICTLYDVGPNYLVMELVEGETLAARLKRGKLSIDQTLQYGQQIADALSVAHAKGITHRDLKPGNIMITKSGVKVLDFGLAKSEQDETLTAANAVMGTPAYMAPEQVEGKECDARTDIYSLGLVLCEMATGKRTYVVTELPPQFAHIVERCIAQDPDSRWQAASDVKAELEWAARTQGITKLRPQAIGEARIALDNEDAPKPAPARSRFRWAALAIAVAALAALAYVGFHESPTPRAVQHLTLAMPADTSRIQSLAISPDGAYLAMVLQSAVSGRFQLWLRPLNRLEATPIPGTDGAQYPFWSPDSREIAFFAIGELKKVKATGGPAVTLCNVTNPRGGSWSRDGVIIFDPNIGSPLQRVSSEGGTPSDLTPKGAVKHPIFLSDGRHFLYLLAQGPREKNGIHWTSLDGKEDRRLLPDESSFAVVGDRLLFVRQNTLMAQRIAESQGTLVGEAEPLASSVSLTSNVNYAPVTASNTGLLVYQAGGGDLTSQIGWYDRSGKLLTAIGALGTPYGPALSPDNSFLAFFRGGSKPDVWLRDLARGADQRFTTNGSTNMNPVWSPRGNRMAFGSNRKNGIFDLYARAVTGLGQDELLLANQNHKVPSQWVAEGKLLLYTEQDPKTKYDIWILPLDGPDGKPGRPTPFLRTEFSEMQAKVSPDGRWAAYLSARSGRDEVYVAAFPSAEFETRISLAGGEQPVWGRDGKELFFIARDGKMMTVPVKTSVLPKPTFEAGAPQALFDAHLAPRIWIEDQYDVSSDGKRFLLNSSSNRAAPSLTVVVNWDAALKK